MFAFMMTLWFWIVVVELVCLFVALAYDSGTFATISLIIFAALLYWVGNVDFVTFFKNNPYYLLFGILIYFSVGTIWSTFKWFMLVLDKKTEYKEHKANFLKMWEKESKMNIDTPMNQNSVDEGLISENVLGRWKNSSYRHNIPQVSEHKYNILRWFAYWPISLVWTIINDFVKRISRAFYNMIRGMFQSISNKVFSDVMDDLE